MDWETPQDFFDEIDNEFHFTLDACANETNHKCDNFFSESDDGLKQNWGGQTVWCNPPYGREIGNWVQKCSQESKQENTTVVMLIPARTDTKYFHEYIYNKPNVEIRFIKGRLRFVGAAESAQFPSMVVVFR